MNEQPAMEPKVELRVLELICSHLCHELISPVTAVNNGMELVADGGADMLYEVSELISNSAAEASGRLQFYRIAYGLGGEQALPISLGEAKRLTEGLLGDGKVSLAWPVVEAGSDGGFGRPGMKVFLNALALGIGTLPRGGKLAVSLDSASRAAMLEATGKGARLEPASREALARSVAVEALTARNVHAHFTGLLAEAAGVAVAVDEGTDRVAFTVSFSRS
jgi:histidine phosphotransferase ChpT